jgi:hypothetical protein
LRGFYEEGLRGGFRGVFLVDFCVDLCCGLNILHEFA